MSLDIQVLKRQLTEFLDSIPDPEPRFELQVAWHDSYEALLRGDELGRGPVSELVDRALANGRVIVQAAGGAGKTVILGRLLRGLSGETLGIYVDLHRWTPVEYEDWRGLPPNERPRFLLKKLGVPAVLPTALETLPANTRRIVIIDGLNEILSAQADQVLEAANALAQQSPQTGVIVADRLVRRSLPDADLWAISSIPPMTVDQVEEVLPDDQVAARPTDLLTSPYFLDAAIKGEGRGISSAGVHQRYYANHIGLTGEPLARTSVAAFRAYDREKARTFAFGPFEADCGPEATAALVNGGAIKAAGERAWFSHHLKHDFLVALYLSGRPTEWHEVPFEVVTFKGASFDCLEMALELLGDEEASDAFVRSLYDWNQYGAAYALAGAKHGGSASVSQSMETALLAMLAERQWDVIAATVQRVRDALEIFRTPLSQRFLLAASLAELQQIVQEAPLAPAMEYWRGLFCRPRGTQATNADIELLLSGDSLGAWTVANVLKRSVVSHDQQARLHEALMTTETQRVVRWRIVHVLGAFPNKKNAAALINAAKGEAGPLVRYGAVRSLMELLALADQRLRQQVLSGTKDVVRSIASEDRLLKEFERAAFVDQRVAPPDWGGLVIGLCRVLYDEATSLEMRDHWERVAYTARGAYLQNPPGAQE